MTARTPSAIASFVCCLALAGCGNSSDPLPAAKKASSTPSASQSPSAAARPTQVLPVTTNPIRNPATLQVLAIKKVLVENNVNPATGKDAPDHLEITLENTGSTALSGFQVFYTFADKTAKLSESYYAELPDTFTVAPGAQRVVHFDSTAAADHFPVNKFSLYHQSRNRLDVTVVVSATGAAVQTASVSKDAGGAENPDE